MDPIVSVAVIRAKARAAVLKYGPQHIDIPNPYPSGSAAHALFEEEVVCDREELAIDV